MLPQNEIMKTTFVQRPAGAVLSVATLLWACGTSTIVGGDGGDTFQVGLEADHHPFAEAPDDSAATANVASSQGDTIQQEPGNLESPSQDAGAQDGAVAPQGGPERTCSELQFRKDSDKATGVEACVGSGGMPDFRVTELHDSCVGAGVGAQVGGGFSAPQPPPCQHDAECDAEGSICFEGTCHLPPVCEQQSQCGAGQTCLCALWNPTPDVGGGGYHAANRCVPAQCENARDCGGRECAVTQDQCGQLSGVYCRTDHDECESTADCGGTGRCSYVTEQARWQCVEAADCD